MQNSSDATSEGSGGTRATKTESRAATRPPELVVKIPRDPAKREPAIVKMKRRPKPKTRRANRYFFTQGLEFQTLLADQYDRCPRLPGADPIHRMVMTGVFALKNVDQYDTARGYVSELAFYEGSSQLVNEAGTRFAKSVSLTRNEKVEVEFIKTKWAMDFGIHVKIPILLHFAIYALRDVPDDELEERLRSAMLFEYDHA